MSNIFPTISTGCFFFIFALSSFVMIGLSDSVGRSLTTLNVGANGSGRIWYRCVLGMDRFQGVSHAREMKVTKLSIDFLSIIDYLTN